ncbi:MAG TPA: hybrid sensor histidine kinase/response regulator [Anaerolineae bacterium]|nr:hybrid sensor histidine kinase/response regulator [Anaerolineae bacterium]
MDTLTGLTGMRSVEQSLETMADYPEHRQEARPLASQAAPATRILYIEDDLGSRLLVKRVLENEGYQILEADTGLAGIALAQENLPDLILVDVNLGEVSGHEVATKLKGTPATAHIPIVALTAATISGDRERALAAGCDGYIAKPIDIDRLPDQVRQFLAGARDTVTDSVRVEKLEEYSRRLVDRLQTTIIELQKANAELRRLDKMKSDFVVLASHELRTPLTLIYGYVNLLRVEVGRLSASDHLLDLTQRLSDATARLSELYDAIVNVSLIDTQRLELTLVPIDLLGVIASVIGEISPIAHQRNLRVTLADFHDLPKISADADYLRRAISNVVSNAVKYTPDGGAVDISYQLQADAIDIVVSDTGIGIDQAEHERVFQKFVVMEDIVHHSTHKSEFLGGGLGLGLSVVRGIVEAHGGRVWVESDGHDPERMPGTRFHVLLPTLASGAQSPGHRKDGGGALP